MSDLLGQLCWYTVTTGSKDSLNLDVTPEQLEEWFAELGLDRTFLPKQARSADAFRVATSGQEVEYVSDGLRYRLYVVEETSGPDVIKRHVMRQAVAGGPATRAADINFYRPRRVTKGRVRGSEDVKYRLHAGLRGVDRAEVQGFIDARLRQFEANRRSLTPHRMRGLLRDYLTHKGAVPIKDGLYFVPMDEPDVIQALRTLTSRLGERCRLMLVPLVDNDDQRRMLQEAIDADVEDRARATVGAIATWADRNPTRPPTPGVLNSWRSGLRDLQGLVDRYGDMWDMAFPQAADALEDLQAATQRFLRVRAG